MKSEQEQKVYDVLEQLNIFFKRYEHGPVFTVEEIRNLDTPIPGEHCKNLFLRNRKGDKHYLVIVSDAKYVDLKGLSQRINSTPLSLASSERLNNHLGVYPGAVSPFGLLNDTEKQVHVLLDSELLDKDTINFHPNVNTATLNLSVRDFLRFLDWTKNPISYVQF
ncbi:prolyl-tRNA synthetase associated domain-containing protein [Neobacillus niacini]|uniref:prolyl-tRNA synthetase associated domain-containing protein n=1 Tax=Neobacillus niacini TaxID=86668 RepID=UPI00285BD074|nr:prolyl-tRNA synthetase associated domain-containing protein [Neobacillus niacini]MDR7001229.1 Ala-tRNA(Pro) deacylase [Neobacillus niacini]